MKPRYVALLIFVTVFAGSNSTFAHVLEPPSGPIKPEFRNPHEVISIYFKAVSRGELIVLEKKLHESMLTPVRVEYVYQLDSAVPKVKIYSELKQPMPVPGQKNCQLRGVSATLDADGRIIETEAHIWPKE